MTEHESANAEQPVIRSDGRTNVIATFWRGEFSIGVSYWVFGLLVGLITNIVPLAVARTIPDTFDPVALFTASLTIWGSFIAISIWQVVGVWRSATRHAVERQRLNRTVFWARAAQFMMILAVVRAVGVLMNTAAPQINRSLTDGISR